MMPANPLSAYSLMPYTYGLIGWRLAVASTASEGPACCAAPAKPARQPKVIARRGLINRYLSAWRGGASGGSIGRPDRQKLVAGFGLVGLPKGEGCQVHVPFRQNVNGENALAGLKMNLRDSQRNPPVVPLPPGQWVGCVECGDDGQRAGGRLSIHRSVEEGK